jgi:hypothetical protein
VNDRVLAPWRQAQPIRDLLAWARSEGQESERLLVILEALRDHQSLESEPAVPDWLRQLSAALSEGLDLEPYEFGVLLSNRHRRATQTQDEFADMDDMPSFGRIGMSLADHTAAVVKTVESFTALDRRIIGRRRRTRSGWRRSFTMVVRQICGFRLCYVVAFPRPKSIGFRWLRVIGPIALGRHPDGPTQQTDYSPEGNSAGPAHWWTRRRHFHGLAFTSKWNAVRPSLQSFRASANTTIYRGDRGAACDRLARVAGAKGISQQLRAGKLKYHES